MSSWASEYDDDFVASRKRGGKKQREKSKKQQPPILYERKEDFYIPVVNDIEMQLQSNIPMGCIYIKHKVVTIMMSSKKDLKIDDIIKFLGDFAIKSVLSLVDEKGDEFARGICNYSSFELNKVLSAGERSEGLFLREVIASNEYRVMKESYLNEVPRSPPKSFTPHEELPRFSLLDSYEEIKEEKKVTTSTSSSAIVMSPKPTIPAITKTPTTSMSKLLRVYSDDLLKKDSSGSSFIETSVSALFSDDEDDDNITIKVLLLKSSSETREEAKLIGTLFSVKPLSTLYNCRLLIKNQLDNPPTNFKFCLFKKNEFREVSNKQERDLPVTNDSLFLREIVSDIAKMTIPIPVSVIMIHAGPLFYQSKKDLHTFEKNLQYDRERDEIVKSLNNRPDVRFQFEFATKSILSEITLKKINILHFSGHGEDGYLIFEREDGGCDLISLEVLERLLENSKRDNTLPDLCILASCKSEKVANKMVEIGIKHVICMSFNLDDQTAIQFVKRFYTTLSQGHSLYNTYKSSCESVHEEIRGGFVLLPKGFEDDSKFIKHHDVQLMPYNFKEKWIQNNFPQSERINISRKNKNIFQMPVNNIQGRTRFCFLLLESLIRPEKRIVVLYGEKRIGKSSIAQLVVSFISERNYFQNGIHYITIPKDEISRDLLISILEDNLLKKKPNSGVGKAVGISEYSDRRIDQILTEMADLKCLIFIDDADIIDSSSLLNPSKFQNILKTREILGRILHQCSGIKILLTCRNSLNTNKFPLKKGFPISIGELMVDGLDNASSASYMYTCLGLVGINRKEFLQRLKTSFLYKSRENGYIMKKEIQEILDNAEPPTKAITIQQQTIMLLQEHDIINCLQGKPESISRFSSLLVTENLSLDDLVEKVISS